MNINHDQILHNLKKIEREQIDLNYALQLTQACYDRLKKKCEWLEKKVYHAENFLQTLEQERNAHLNELLKPDQN